MRFIHRAGKETAARVQDQQTQVELVIANREKDLLPIIATLGDVVRNTGYNHARTPGHV